MRKSERYCLISMIVFLILAILSAYFDILPLIIISMIMIMVSGELLFKVHKELIELEALSKILNHLILSDYEDTEIKQKMEEVKSMTTKFQRILFYIENGKRL